MIFKAKLVLVYTTFEENLIYEGWFAMSDFQPYLKDIKKSLQVSHTFHFTAKHNLLHTY